MYCKNCGKEIDENVNFCPYCGASQSSTSHNTNGTDYDPFNEKKEYNPFDEQKTNYQQTQQNSEPPIKDLISNYNESKFWAGFLMGFFFNLVGLVVGFLIYPTNTIARKTFVKGWWWSFGIYIAVIVLYLLIIFASVSTV